VLVRPPIKQVDSGKMPSQRWWTIWSMPMHKLSRKQRATLWLKMPNSSRIWWKWKHSSKTWWTRIWCVSSLRWHSRSKCQRSKVTWTHFGILLLNLNRWLHSRCSRTCPNQWCLCSLVSNPHGWCNLDPCLNSNLRSSNNHKLPKMRKTR
jgi:hypothetical protein